MPAVFATMLLLSSLSFPRTCSVVGFNHCHYRLPFLFKSIRAPSCNKIQPQNLLVNIKREKLCDGRSHYSNVKSLSLSTEPFESAGRTDAPLVMSKFFQLEEKEDKESCSTEIFLSNDGSVTVGDTDGPLPLQASGTWKQTGEKFNMTIKRTFGSGQEGRDVGEFKFDVERVYIGFLEYVGGSIAVDGSMHLKDESRGDMEVGYFSMIDTTESKLGSEDAD